MEEPRKIEITPLDVLVTFIIVTSGIMIFQLLRSRFEPASSVFISLLICGVAGLVFVRRVVLPAKARYVVAVALMGLMALLFRWSPFLYIYGEQDQGIYVAMSAHFARTGGPTITDRVREGLSNTGKAEYDKLNHRHDLERTFSLNIAGHSEGVHEAGVYIGDLSRSAYVFQFYPLHPLWMALGAKALGDEDRVYSLVAFSLLSVLMLSLLTYELADRARTPAFLVAALLAINPLHVFLSRFPVTENISLFFSASALYYLVRYVKTRGAQPKQAWNLVLSAGAWGCLFFNHIGGFLYAPLILAMVIAGIASARSFGQMRSMAVYGLAVFLAYSLSLWYGMTWSFPYSVETYRLILGNGLGTFFLSHWKGIIFVLLIAYGGLVSLAWRLRRRIQSSSAKLRIDRAVMVTLLVTLVGTFFYAMREVFGPGFQTNGTQANAILHTSLIALAIYVSPFILIFVLVASVVQRRSMGIRDTFLLILIMQFLIVRVGIESVTPYYKYGRYLGVELVPYILVLAALLLHRLFKGEGWHGKVVAGGTFGLALAWEGIALAQQYPGGELHRLDASMRPAIEQIRDTDLVLLAGEPYPPLRTALDYYYGKHTVVVERGHIQAAIRRYADQWGDLYILSDTDTLSGYSYLGATSLVEDAYATGHFYDVLPTNSSMRERRYFLYRVNRPVSTSLRNGDSITFDARGNARNYLGTGWSGQESWGRWTEGPLATLQLPMSERSSAATLRFEVLSRNCVGVTVRVNAEVRTRWSFSDCQNYVNQSLLLSPEDLRRGAVTVSFEMSGSYRHMKRILL